MFGRQWLWPPRLLAALSVGVVGGSSSLLLALLLLLLLQRSSQSFGEVADMMVQRGGELYLLFNAPKIQMPSRLSSEVLKEMRGEMMAKPSQVGPHQV
jgi:hypothetical protein